MFGDDRVVLAATDFSEACAGVVAYAADLAEHLDRTLLILHAVETSDPDLVRDASEAITAQAEAVLRDRPGLDVCTGVIVGSATEVIATQARDAFVMVVGTGRDWTGPGSQLPDCPLVVAPSESSAAHHELALSGRL